MRAFSGCGLGEKVVNKETGRIKQASNHHRHFKRTFLQVMEKMSPPPSNRFQSLEDMEMEDILQYIENIQTSTTPIVGKEAEREDDDRHSHKIQSIATPTPQEGEAIQQAIIFKDSATSNKHKRNKSLEGVTEKSMKIGGKGKKGKEPFVQLDENQFTRKFGFQSVISNANNKIWCFAKCGVDMQMIQDHEQFLHLKVNPGAPQEDIFCTFIYAKCYRNSRRLLWEELTSISNRHDPWLVGGDFNVILHPNENQGGDMRRLGSIDDFNDMMIDTGLMDAGFEEDPFTWTNKRVWKRLDRVLYSKEWTDTYNSTRVQHLPRRLSDHHPLFITAVKTENRKAASFRFQNIIKELLKRWNTEVFGNVFTTVEQAKQEAEEAEKKFDRDPSEANLIALNKGNAALVHALSLESEYWRQKSNCKWLEDGERNTKYFHSLVKKKRLKSTIHRILKENQEISNPNQIKDSAARYFENLLSGTSTRNDTPDFSFQFSKLSQDELRSISNIPTQEEIKDIVFSIDKDSVAGPDFFSVFSKSVGISSTMTSRRSGIFCGTLCRGVLKHHDRAHPESGVSTDLE
ncbi:UNVERIFIED_CONTAM: hypothetical protein Sradi_6540000 [Sesamum radiatum]|uniref:Endonuclease/exonuclease/phosphatase domain-containing protein n=1 Tax=Sesamum radiatum TaxID=300843 RepID=A0AAW2JVZ6_SESRA